MAKIRKNQRRKRFQYNKNRKRMNRNKKQLPQAHCKIVSDKWSAKRSTEQNMKKMGLVFDVNDLNSSKKTGSTRLKEIASKLETEANAPRASGYRLPKNQVEFLTYMLNKYGEDYVAMTRDKKNVAQLTWKQFRTKVNSFKSIPEQFEPFLEERKGLEVMPVTNKIAPDDDDL